MREYGGVVDCCCRVDDQDALRECLKILKVEGLSVGVTAGSVLVAASHLASRNPGKKVIAIAPDGGEGYADILENIVVSGGGTDRFRGLEIRDCSLGRYVP
jgi:cysteine synthase